MGTTQVSKGNNTIQSAFEFTDVGLHTAGDRFKNLIRNLTPRPFGFRAQNRKSGFKIRRLDVGGKAPFKAGSQSFIQCDQGFWRAVRSDDNLLILPMQSVKGMEEFLLCGFFSGNELDIIYEQNISRTIFLSKSLIGMSTNGIDHVVGEFLRRYIQHGQTALMTGVPNRMEEMSFT